MKPFDAKPVAKSRSGSSRDEPRFTTIRFVTRKWPPAVGGMETYSIRLSEALAVFQPVETIKLPGRPDGSPPSAVRLTIFGLATAIRLLFARRPADVTHVGDMASWPLALAARLRSRRGRIALSAHGTDVSFPLRGGVLGHLYGRYLSLGARLLPGVVVIANSEATAKAVRRNGFGRTAVVPLATDIRSAPMARKHNGGVLFAGRLIPMKGCAWFIRNVLPLLPEEVTLTVAGKVWNEDEAAALQNPRVTFLGPVRGDELIRAYASALCVVLPNIEVPDRTFEGFGLIAIEAAAAGGVVLASEHGGLKEALIDAETGFHLPSGDAEKWASMICEIRDWPDEKREKFIRKAVETTCRIYSWDRVARETLAAYAHSL